MAALPQLGCGAGRKAGGGYESLCAACVESASKLAVEPDMTDTARMRPEIDYTITPLSLRTTLSPRPIRPATVTYWEFNRPLPFYLKVGAGYPLNSVLDFYASSQNPSTGYLTGYVNHEGRYADIRNDFGVADNNSMQMKNRAGVAAGKYFGRHILEGGAVVRQPHVPSLRRLFAAPGSELAPAPGSMVDFGDANLLLRFGDGFQNLERTNFEVVLSGGMFFDHSDWAAGVIPGSSCRWRGYGRIARGFGRHMLSATLGYEYLAGKKAFEGTDQGRFHAALRYGFRGGVASGGRSRLLPRPGGECRRSRTDRGDGNYLIPFAHLDFNLGTPGLKPFLEVDGSVNDNSLRSMMYRNPYTASEWLDRSSVDYNGRFGLNGTLWNNRFSYRAYAGLTIHDNHVYWMALRNIRLDDAGTRSETFTGLFSPVWGARP